MSCAKTCCWYCCICCWRTAAFSAAIRRYSGSVCRIVSRIPSTSFWAASGSTPACWAWAIMAAFCFHRLQSSSLAKGWFVRGSVSPEANSAKYLARCRCSAIRRRCAFSAFCAFFQSCCAVSGAFPPCSSPAWFSGCAAVSLACSGSRSSASRSCSPVSSRPIPLFSSSISASIFSRWWVVGFFASAA